MKKYTIILLLTGILGCKEQFLDISPTDRYTEQNYWQSESQAIAGVSGGLCGLNQREFIRR